MNARPVAGFIAEAVTGRLRVWTEGALSEAGKDESAAPADVR